MHYKSIRARVLKMKERMSLFMWFYSIKPSIIFILFSLHIFVTVVCTLFIPQNVQFFNVGKVCGQQRKPPLLWD